MGSRIRTTKLALVLGGGGSKGALQAGLRRAMCELAVRPDLVVGASVGAINGAFIAAGIEELAEEGYRHARPRLRSWLGRRAGAGLPAGRGAAHAGPDRVAARVGSPRNATRGRSHHSGFEPSVRPAEG